MAWQALLKSVPPVSFVTSSFDIEVEYFDDAAATRRFVQTMKLVAGQVTSLADVRNQVLSQLSDLNKLDLARNILVSRVGQQF